MVSCIDEGVRSCVFVRLECVQCCYDKLFEVLSCIDSSMWKIDAAMCPWCCWGIVYIWGNKEDPCLLKFVQLGSNAPHFQVCFLPRACLLPIISIWVILLLMSNIDLAK